MYNVNDNGTSRLLFSASDITSLAACEWRTVRRIDFLLGLPGSTELPPENDAMLKLAGEAGHRFEKRVLSDLRAKYGDEHVVEFPDITKDADTAVFTQLAEQTLEHMRSGTRVIHQATVFNGEMRGHIDFLIRDDTTDEIIYQVIDTKLARHVKVTALMQLASYYDQLDSAGIPPSPTVSLWLGDGAKTEHKISDILPTYRRQRQRLRDLVADRQSDTSASTWGDMRYDACGRCETCKAEIKSHDDVIQVAGIMRSQRRLLIAAGVTRLDELAEWDPEDRVEGIPRKTLKKLVTQAKAQVATRQGDSGVPVVEFRNPAFLSRIPKPSAGDIFFDFEGNPLDDENPDAIAEENKWGIDYLFGVQSATFIPDSEQTDALKDPQFSYYWADDKAQERKAFDEFMTWLAGHRAAHPDMHIYHYAAYEKTHLLSLAQRHDIHVEAVDDLIRQGVLVDLYPITKAALVIGSHSYSIKKLEPLYMGDEVRSGLDNAADSVKDYDDYRFKLDELTFETDPAQRDAISERLEELKRSIIDYNRYDCRSTLKLRDWLIERADEAGVAIGVRPIIDERPPPPVPPSYLALRSLIDDVDPEEREPLHEAVAIAASAVVYHRNEDKKWWREHFERTSQEDVDDWVDVRDSVIFDPDDVTVLMRGLGEDSMGWYLPAGKRTPRRRIRAKMAKIIPGTKLDKLDGLFVAYPSFDIDEEINGADPLPHAPAPEMHTFYLMCKLESVEIQGDYVEFDETLKGQQPRFSVPPVALVPGKPLPQDSVKKAIDEWARDLYSRVVDEEISIPPAGSEEANLFEEPSRWPSFGRDAQAILAGESLVLWGDPMFDILLRRPPRAAVFSSQSENAIPAIVDALKSMDDSFVAVQGPPGTGKTFTGGRVIAQLLSEGWKIGVVSQAHLTVENMLESVIEAGADPALVGKRPKKDDAGTPQPWEVIDDSAPAVVAWQAGKDKFVLGGTKWTFSNDVRFKDLDLLVVDEAGQYSLADTMACSVAAKRLLLLGDPQQLAQVTQGVHLEKVDKSGLGWIVGEADVISPDLGFLMRQTYRMNDGVREVVSNLSYAGQLTSDESANRRVLDSVKPGLALSRVRHEGNSVESVEEAERIVSIVGDLIGNDWSGPKTHGGDSGAPLREEDIIVVSPYNAQVDLVSSHLANAGYPGVRVGTVDRFQGREAAVSIVSLAASSQRDVPRGIEFLLEPNRLNVAISRAQFASILVYSPAIETFVPTNEDSLKLLSDFLNVVDQGHEYLARPSL